MDKINKFVATEEDLKKIIGEIDKENATTGVTNTIYNDVVNNPCSEEQERSICNNETQNKELSAEEKEEKDYQEIRKNIYKITEKALTALDLFQKIATESQHPHAYATLAQLLKTVIECQKTLSKIYVDRSTIEKNKIKPSVNIDKQKQPQNITNNLICTTADLDKMIAEITKKQLNGSKTN